MENDKDKIERSRPAEEGRKKGPDLRDRSDAQPGVQTISTSPTEDANERLTKTAADGFEPVEGFRRHADKTYDDVDDPEKGQSND